MTARRLEELYETIGNAVAAALGPNWIRAWIVAKLNDDHAEFDFKYQIMAEEPAKSFAREISSKMNLIYPAFEEIRLLTCEAERGYWNAASFELDKDGSFKLSFSYD
jgi:hypothetical protein